MYVYHVWSPIELFLICLYFNERVNSLKRTNGGIVVGCVGIIVAIVNVFFLQPIHTLNSIFLMYEGFAIIALCLFSFYELVRREDEIVNNVHFWLSTIFLIYWSAVFMYWGMYHILRTSLQQYMSVSTYIIMIVNILEYCGVSLVLLNYRKMISNG